MRIAIASWNLCMRATQSAMCAQDAKHEIGIFVPADAVGRQYTDLFSSACTFYNPEMYRKELKQFKPDLIWVHDRPHKFPALTIEIAAKELPGVPVVHDVHDMFSVRVPGTSAPEDSPFEAPSIKNADGLVFVSQANLDYAAERYAPLPPALVVRSAVYSKLFPNHRGTPVGGAVWGGGLYTEPPKSDRSYIDQREICQRFRAVGITPFIYHAPCEMPSSPKDYSQAGCIVVGMRGYTDLCYDYTRYDFGWYGQTEDHRQIHDTIPNKLFEYVAGGLPVVVINAREAGKFVEDNHLGVHIRRPEDIIYRMDELDEIRRTCWTSRWEFTREKECEKLWPWMEGLVRAKQNRR